MSSNYSEHFSKKEFKYIDPEEILLTVLENLRYKTKDSVIITDGARTIQQHIDTYKKLESQDNLGGKTWIEAIPWGSKHLPAFGMKLRAVDLKAIKTRDLDRKVTEYYTGKEIYSLLKEVESELNVNLGIGVGNFYCHLDVGRERPTNWGYNY
tara:strand:+ start:13681 stop:14139 length:459 start_codon:yes stop_codon:yes gene_type:complete